MLPVFHVTESKFSHIHLSSSKGQLNWEVQKSDSILKSSIAISPPNLVALPTNSICQGDALSILNLNKGKFYKFLKKSAQLKVICKK